MVNIRNFKNIIPDVRIVFLCEVLSLWEGIFDFRYFKYVMCCTVSSRVLCTGMQHEIKD